MLQTWNNFKHLLQKVIFTNVPCAFIASVEELIFRPDSETKIFLFDKVSRTMARNCKRAQCVVSVPGMVLRSGPFILSSLLHFFCQNNTFPLCHSWPLKYNLRKERFHSKISHSQIFWRPVLVVSCFEVMTQMSFTILFICVAVCAVWISLPKWNLH